MSHGFKTGVYSLLLIATWSVTHTEANAASAQTANPQITQLNNQIQNQLKQMQAQNLQQITTLNNQIQQQLKQVQATLQGQIQQLNTQNQNQIKQVQATFQQQMAQLQKQINEIGKNEIGKAGG